MSEAKAEEAVSDDASSGAAHEDESASESSSDDSDDSDDDNTEGGAANRDAEIAALRQELQLLDMQVVVINPGAMRTPLLTAQLRGGNNAFLEKPPADSLFAAAMRKGAVVAQDYMERHAKDPTKLAPVVFKAVHVRVPAPRYCFGVSTEMRLAGLTPQWVLDAATSQLLK